MVKKQSVRMKAETCRTLAFGSILGDYKALGTPLENASQVILVQNYTNEPLMFSFNGVDDHFPVDAHGYFILDISANKSFNGGFFISEGETLYVKSLGALKEGSVYFTSFYAK